MIKIDMWYGDTLNTNTDTIDCYFNDLSCIYSGNIYRNGKIIGDYVSDDSLEIEALFPGIFGN